MDHSKKLCDPECCGDCSQNHEESFVPKPRSRPDVVQGFTEKVAIGCGNIYITANYDDKGIVEIFTNNGKAGGCPSQSEATARLVSIALRARIPADDIINQLKGIRCPSTIRQQNMKVTSCPDAIAKVIQKVMKLNKEAADKNKEFAKEIILPIDSAISQDGRLAPNENSCPECSGKIEHEGGCVICRQCGYSKCG